MAALGASLPRLLTRERGPTNPHILKNSTTFYLNSLVGVSSGVLAPWADTAGFVFRGLLVNSTGAEVVEGTGVTKVVGNTSATPPIRGIVDESGKIVMNVTVAGIASTSKGALVYCPTDNPNDFTLTPTTNVGPVGRVENFVSTGYGDVRLFTPTEAAGGNSVSPLTGDANGTADGALADVDDLTDYTKHASGGTTVTSNAATDLDTTAAALETFRDEQAAINTVIRNNLADIAAKVNAIIS